MPRVEYERLDLPIRIRSGKDGSVSLSSHRGEPSLDDALPFPLALSDPLRAPAVRRALEEWWQGQARGTRAPGARLLPRITLQIDDPQLAKYYWEGTFAAHAPSALVVRTSPVRPRAAHLPLAFPLRSLQVDREPGAYSLGDHWTRMFERFGPHDLGHAVVAGECSFEALRDGRYQDWPTVDILHFDSFATRVARTELLSTAQPDTPGTLGWLLRWLDTNQTRLVVLGFPYRADWPELELAAAIVARGGPAVLLNLTWRKPERDQAWELFYDRLLHDEPIDVALATTHQRLAAAWAHTRGQFAVFGGAGREDLLRVSSVGTGLLELSSALTSPEPSAVQALAELQVALATQLGSVQNELAELSGEWPGYNFEQHEGEGFLPLSRRVQRLRDVTHLTQPRVRPAPSLGPRHLNSSFSREGPEGTLSRIEPRGARLLLGELYQLELSIGLKDASLPTFGSAPLPFEEFFKRNPEAPGIWVEIGVTGLDFEVLGDPVQELWLPQTGATDPIHFAVSPRRARASRLRFCLYFGNDLVQSIRVAAVTVSPDVSPDEAMTAADARVELANALELDVHEVHDAGYLSRVEYTLTDSLEHLPERPRRKLSIIANHRDEASVITLKGPDVFHVHTDNLVSQRVSQVRQALANASVRSIDGLAESDWPYAFGGDNTGDEATFKDALRDLAVAGCDLYTHIVPQDTHDRLEPLLAEPQVIHVAHVLLQDVIPWAAIYDRPYDAGRSLDDQGAPVDHDVCLAPLSRAADSPSSGPCGSEPECLLHPDRLKQRRASTQRTVSRDTVVCPLHFWGFKHMMEIPPQQVQGAGGGRSLRRSVAAGAIAHLCAGMNATLDPKPPATRHVDELEALVAPLPPCKWISKHVERDKVLEALQQLDLDLIYFYCHAHGAVDAAGMGPPVLEIQTTARPEQGWIKPSDLARGARWTHHPLVFLNGCGTAGFSADALSPFITTLVRDRWASGVVGTEIAVREALAREFARLFLSHFLAGKSAGEAMLGARLALLAKKNPLGLIYTLFAAADLCLERASSSSTASSTQPSTRSLGE
jgi:hypothetical protein